MMRIPYMPWRGRRCPIVEVGLRANGREVRTLGYLDTGATFSVFHSDFCGALGLKLKDGEKVGMSVGDGGRLCVYVHRVEVRIEKLRLKTDIHFTDGLRTGVNILGREGLLDRYRISFDGPKREIIWQTKAKS